MAFQPISPTEAVVLASRDRSVSHLQLIQLHSKFPAANVLAEPSVLNTDQSCACSMELHMLRLFLVTNWFRNVLSLQLSFLLLYQLVLFTNLLSQLLLFILN